MKNLKILATFIFVAFLSSCENEKSLQKYYVENQEDSDFLALDVPTSMFTNSESLNPEQKTTLESIKKINLLALKVDEDPTKFEEEKARLEEIFTDEKYQLLMKYGGGNRKAALYFTGEEDAIDEMIVYGYDDAKGLGVARVLGEDMDPAKIMELMKSLDKDDINVGGIEELSQIFDSERKQKDSLNVDMERQDSTAVDSDSISE